MRLLPLASLLLGLSGLTVRLAAQAAPAAEPTIEGAPLSSVAQSVLSTRETSYWAGQIFTITHKITALRRLNPQLDGNYEWNGGGLNTEDWGPAVMHEDDTSIWYEQSTRGYTMKAGTLALPGGTQGVVLNTGVSEGSFVTQTKTGRFDLHSTAPTLTIRPLPSPVPDNFTGAVGDFSLKASLSSATVKVGDSVTWVMTLAGVGNWPEITSLPPRLISKEFDVVRPVVKKNLKEGSLFDGSLTEETLLVPNKPGTYQLGPLRFVYFDPKLGKYQMLTSETVTVQVDPVIPGQGPAAKTTGPREHVAVPDAPPILPLAPLDSSDTGLSPFPLRRLAIPVAVPIIALAIFWFVLAAQRRWITDRLYQRRSARNRVAAIVGQLEGASAPTGQALREKLFEWQQATATFGGMTVSTPNPDQIARGIAGHFKPEVGAAWSRLWTDANHVIYGPKTALPADWTTRAKAALHDAPLDDVPIFAAFYPRNLLPFVALVILALSVATAQADPGTDAYSKGHFSTAESLWRKAVAATPKDAHAHYNLSLALAQQDRWSESAGEALSAFCLDPRDPDIRWQFALSLDRSGIDYPVFSGLAHGEGFYRVTRILSPAAWELLVCFASLIFALAAGRYLFEAYRGTLSRGMRRGNGVIAILALLLAGASAYSLHLYGPLAQRDIVFVSQATLLETVPNATDTLQKTAPLVAGTLTHTLREFLGWTQVRFSNGQTGWVRTDLLISLYR